LVANSPGLIAGSNVLHRLLVPRHPPIALSSLSQQQNKQNRYKEMLASTIQFSKYGQKPARTTTYQGEHPSQGNNPPRTNTHTNGLVKAGPSHPPNRSTGRTVTLEETVQLLIKEQARSLRTQQRASTTPHNLTHVPRHHPQVSDSSTSSIDQVRGLMVNVPQSEAPSPRDERPGSDE
jgi:hypothetical protein